MMAGQGTTTKMDVLRHYSTDDNRPMAEQFIKRRDVLRSLVTKHLIEVMPFHGRFFTDIVPEMYVETMKNEFSQERIQNAFEILEMYCLNLIHYYWKPEISRLKRYTGAYQVKLLDVLPGVDVFVQKIGYKLDRKTDTFYLREIVCAPVLWQMALDCFVVQKHCEFLDAVLLTAQERSLKLKWADICALVDTYDGSVENCAELVWQVTDTRLTPDEPRSLCGLIGSNVDDIDDNDMYG